MEIFESEDRKERILAEYGAVRDSGRADMDDARSVQRVAHDMGLYLLTGYLGNEPESQHQNILDALNN